MENIVSYKCKNCGAPLEFDIQKQNHSCKFCLSEFAVSELSGQDVSTPDTPPEIPHDEYGDGAMAYSCSSCGGKIVTDTNTVSTFCVYCHSPTIIAANLTGEYRPAKVIPFKLGKEEVKTAMCALLKKRPLLPKDFRMFAEKGEISGMYVPFWLFSADMQGFLAAQGVRVMSWSDANFRYTKTDTFHVERAADVAFNNLPADGSAKMDSKLTQALEPFDYAAMQDFSMQYLSGHFAESYDIDSESASVHAFNRMDSGLTKMLEETVTGYNSYSVTARHNQRRKQDAMYVMLPVWTLSADYKGKRYTFAMNGQTGKMVGKLPTCAGRAFAWFGGIFAAVSLVAFVGGMLI